MGDIADERVCAAEVAMWRRRTAMSQCCWRVCLADADGSEVDRGLMIGVEEPRGARFVARALFQASAAGF